MKIEDFNDVKVKTKIYTKRLDMKQLRSASFCSSSLWRQMVRVNQSYQCKMTIEDEWIWNTISNYVTSNNEITHPVANSESESG